MLLPVVAAIGGAVVALAGWSAWIGRRAERLAPAEGVFADVPGARLHYVALGPEDGPPIVMIHGLMGQLRNFSHSLAERMARDHRVILIDRPGWGYSRLTGPRAGIVAQAGMIAALIERLELKKPLILGHSMGGAVSLALALDRPDLVGGLALIAPFTQPIRNPPEVFKALLIAPGLRTAAAWTLATPAALASGRARAKIIFAPDPVSADFPTRGGGVLSIRPASFESGAFELGVARGEITAIAARLGEISMPVAILYGRQDGLLDPELHGRRTAEAIPGAVLTLVDGGHMLPVTQPELVERWLRNPGGASG